MLAIVLKAIYTFKQVCQEVSRKQQGKRQKYAYIEIFCSTLYNIKLV